MPHTKLNLQQLPHIIDAIPVRIFWKDLKGFYLGANQHFINDANVASVDELIGKSDFDMSWTQEQAEGFRADDQEVIKSGIPKLDIEEEITLSDGSSMWLNTNKVPIYDEGELIGVLGTYQDITENKLAFKAVEYRAGHDDLTNLPNRHYLLKVLQQYLERPNREHFGGLLFIDLDHFKNVNDSLGHSVGDHLLSQVAARIKTAAQDTLVARLGGDEFCILITNHDASTQKEQLEQQLIALAQSVIASLIQPYQEDCHTLYIGASIGITVIEPGDNDASEKMKEADLALFAAKDSGRNIEVLFDNRMRQAVQRRHALENELRHAIAHNELSLHYQPQYDNQGAIIGAEALLRWNNASHGNISPAEFIPVAELSGLINSIGSWVLEAAVKKLATHQATFAEKDIKYLAINVSAKQFQRPGFALEVSQMLAKYHVTPKYLQIEVTETLLMEKEERIRHELDTLRSLDITIAMDDFGTGYSSLSYLTRLPIDKLKVDRSFVHDLNDDSRNRSIVETVISMTKKLGIASVAEGVETQKELDCLKSIGCDAYQGFYLSRPIPEAEFDKLIKAYGES